MKRKSFTLIEVLMVIVVLGIISAMMTMQTSKVKKSADASNIIGRLRNAKMAAMSMYVASLDTWERESSSENFKFIEVKRFLNNDNKYDNNFVIVTSGGNAIYARRAWYVAYNVSNDTELAEKIAGRVTQDEQFYGSASILSDGGTYSTSKTFTASDKAVLLLVKRGVD